MNQAVLVANGGRFPVMVSDAAAKGKYFTVDKDGYMDEVHYRMTDKTHLNWLADFINFHTTILSPGDLLIHLGSWLGGYSLAVWSTMVIGDLTRRKQTLS